MTGATIRRLHLCAELRRFAEREALAAHPRECCGLIEGVRDGDVATAVTLHPVRNIAAGNDRFELDPAAQIAWLRAARARGSAIIGCYHSHPGGRAEPSDTDRAGAGEENFLWLIIAAGSEKTQFGAFIHAGGDFAPVTLEDGAALEDGGGATL